MKKLVDMINEASQVAYKVQFVGDNNIEATITIDHKDADTFEEFLAKEEGNIFAHAMGGNIEEY